MTKKKTEEKVDAPIDGRKFVDFDLNKYIVQALEKK